MVRKYLTGVPITRQTAPTQISEGDEITNREIVKELLGINIPETTPLVWGNIGGDISDQQDLTENFADKDQGVKADSALQQVDLLLGEYESTNQHVSWGDDTHIKDVFHTMAELIDTLMETEE